MTEVHVSKVFHVDENSPEVLEQIARLAKRGFTVLGPIVLEPVAAEPEPEPEPAEAATPGWEVIRGMRKELKRAAGLKTRDIAALLGVSVQTIHQWSCKSLWINGRGCPEARVEAMRRLLEWAKSQPDGSTNLLAEAQRARLVADAMNAPRKKARPIDDGQRLAIGTLAEKGFSVSRIAATVGRSRRTVKSVLDGLGV